MHRPIGLEFQGRGDPTSRREWSRRRNEINSDDDCDVHCVHESVTRTRVRQQVCRPQFEGRISRQAAVEYLAAIKWRCQGGLTADCIFSDLSSGGISAAQGVEAEAPNKRDLMKREIERLANEDPQFARAILDFYDATLRYEEQRQSSRDRRRER